MSDPTRTPLPGPSAFEAVTAPMRLHLPERRAPDLTRTPCGANWIPISGRTLTALLSLAEEAGIEPAQPFGVT